MRRLVFIDDDQTELESFRVIVKGEYDCTTVHWPRESAKLFRNPPPDIFVSDLYLPSPAGDAVPGAADRDAAAEAAKRVAARFSRLSADPGSDHKARLRETMAAISEAYAMLERQWRALGQSPAHGISLLAKLRHSHPEVPFVFYSRKITPEDVIRVLQAGAADAIRKGVLPPREVLARLAAAQKVRQREDLRGLRVPGLNLNVTTISKDLLK